MSAATVIRVTIANIDAPTLAKAVSAACPWVNGTIVSSLGFGSWGTESGVTMESAFASENSAPWQLLLESVADILAARGEECAYVTFDGVRAYLLYPAKTDAIGAPYRYELRPIL